MSDLVPVKRALISVSDKSGLAEFARALVNEFKVQLISTGGTAKFLREQGLTVTDVSEVTGFPEMMDGRVKTLHPKVHGGLLALRDNAEHVAAMQKHDIQPIDLVCINLYPFEKTIAKPGVSFEEAIENIDIGGPSMVRSASKNHRFVVVITAPEQYEKVLGDLRKHGGCTCEKHRLKLAQQAFAHTGAYDARIASYLSEQLPQPAADAIGSGAARFRVEPQHGAVATAAATLGLPELPPPGEPHRPGPLLERLINSTPHFNQFLHEIVITQASQVGGTEAVAFIAERQGEEFSLTTIDHVRPGECDQETREAAIKAFRDLVAPCVAQGKDGAIEVGSPDGGDAQYCLVTVLRDEGNVVAVSAVITRCRDMEQAKQRLVSMQIVAGYFDLYYLRKRVDQFIEAQAKPGASTSAPSPTFIHRLLRLVGLTGAAVTQLPDTLHVALAKKSELRYGENPHQKAALYVDSPATESREASVAFATQHHGKELSYINLLDADAALAVVKEFTIPAACIVKHATPCGVAMADDLPTAFRDAFAGDPLAAFGGIVALNKPVDLATAQAITSIDKLLEVIVAPSYAPDALELLKTRWKNVRLLEVGPVAQLSTQHSALSTDLAIHTIARGYLIQQRDLLGIDELNWKVVSKRQPTAKEMADLKLAWLACKHVKSNAIVIAGNAMMYGSGAGQQDRVSACRIAIAKAGERVRGAVAASDAFFPFPDGPQLLLDAGVTAIIHPGGSVKDKETIDLADQRGAAMVLTGQRHFKH